METYSSNDKIILGRGKGIEILDAVKKATKSVKIVSPYLSPSYIEELIKLHEKGIEVTLITCDDLETDNRGYSDFKHTDIIKQEKILIPKIKEKKKSLNLISLILFLSLLPFLFLIYLSLAFIYPALILIIIGISIYIYSVAIKEYSYNYTTIFKLKVFDSKSSEKPESTNLIHSKIFLIDDNILYLGSANFTYSAFKTHYETILKILDPRAIKDVSIEIENIFNSKELRPISIQEWGKRIYE